MNPSSSTARTLYILGQLVKRDVLLRYRGAMFGVLWLVLNPLIMLAIYSFVFGHIFKGRWPDQQEGTPFWLILYSGLIAFNVFSESVSRAPAAVRGHANFVKKIIFPVHILPLVPLGSALVHGAFNLLILLAALLLTGALEINAALYPVLLLPLVLFALGASYFLSAWGVFIKDMNQIVGPLLQMLLFLSPVLYPVSAVPESLRPIYEYNPIGAVIEACRSSALGGAVNWDQWMFSALAGTVTAVLGWHFFQSCREEFPDAL